MYTTIRVVREGQPLTFCYSELPWDTPCDPRRLTLLTRFDFVCMCQRCQRPDPLRELTCGCGGRANLDPGRTADDAKVWTRRPARRRWPHVHEADASDSPA